MSRMHARRLDTVLTAIPTTYLNPTKRNRSIIPKI
jgi:hypothetical protein